MQWKAKGSKISLHWSWENLVTASQTRWGWCKGSPPWKVHFKNLSVPPQGPVCWVSAVIQDDCTTPVWPISMYEQENSHLLIILHWWKAHSILQDKEIRQTLLIFHPLIYLPVIPHWRLWHLFISLLATGTSSKVSEGFIYFANTPSKFSFPLEHFQGKWD